MKWKAVMFTCPTLPAGQTVKIKHLKPDLLEESLVTDGSEVNSPNLAIHSDIHEKRLKLPPVTSTVVVNPNTSLECFVGMDSKIHSVFFIWLFQSQTRYWPIIRSVLTLFEWIQHKIIELSQYYIYIYIYLYYFFLSTCHGLGGEWFPSFVIGKSWESILDHFENKSLTERSVNMCLILWGLCLCVFGTHFVTTMWSPGCISSCQALRPPTEVMDRISVSWSTAPLEADEKRLARTRWLIFFHFIFMMCQWSHWRFFSVSFRTLNHFALKKM